MSFIKLKRSVKQIKPLILILTLYQCHLFSTEIFQNQSTGTSLDLSVYVQDKTTHGLGMVGHYNKRSEVMRTSKSTCLYFLNRNLKKSRTSPLQAGGVWFNLPTILWPEIVSIETPPHILFSAKVDQTQMPCFALLDHSVPFVEIFLNLSIYIQVMGIKYDKYSEQFW